MKSVIYAAVIRQEGEKLMKGRTQRVSGGANSTVNYDPMPIFSEREG